jgi:hypothetical protein
METREGKNRGKSGGKKLSFCTAMFLSLAGSTSSVSAIEASDVLVYSKGPVSLRPHVGAFTEYNDNIFYRGSNVKSDVIFDLAPGVKLLVGENKPKENHIYLDYRMDQLWYMDDSGLDALQHRAMLNGRYSTGRTTIEGKDEFTYASTPLGGGFSITGQKVSRAIETDLYRLSYKLGQRAGIYGEGWHSSTDFDKGIPLFDTRTLQGTAGFEWEYSEDTFLFGEIFYGETSLTRNDPGPKAPGQSFVGAFVGGRGNFTKKLVGTVKAGYQYNWFEEVGGVSTPSTDAPVVQASLLYKARERMTVEFAYSRQQRISVEFTRSPFTVDGVSGKVSAIFGSSGRLLVTAGGHLSFHEYDPSPAFASRTDMLWTVDPSVSWYFETWLSMKLQYEFNHFESNLAGVVDYDQNRIILGVEAGF